MKKITLILSIVLFVILAGIVVTKKPARKTPIYIGAWTAGLWDNTTKTLHPESLKSYEATIGKKMSIAHIYKGWQELDYPSTNIELQKIYDNGWMPMVSANPYAFEWCQTKDGQSIYKAIAEGNCDSFLHKIAGRFQTFDKPVFLRYAWEMNIQSNSWSLEKTHSTPEEYINAWRHIHDIFVKDGATKVIWVYCPNVKSPTSIDFKSTYPGDKYVDWIGLDGYNWGTTQSWSSWQSFHDVYTDSYNELTAIAPDKPLMLGEVGTTDKGGDKPSWYTDMLSNQLLYAFPQVKAVVFYNEDRTVTEQVNWNVDISEASLKAFKEGIKNPVYSSDPVE